MKEELRPCPWCGSVENLSIDTEANTCTGIISEWYASVTCECFSGDYCHPMGRTGKTEEEAVLKATRVWNTRPIEDTLRAEVTALKTEVKKWESKHDTVFEMFNIRADPKNMWEARALEAEKLYVPRLNEAQKKRR